MNFEASMSPTMPASEAIDPDLLSALSVAAWRARENAHIVGMTRVGCAALSSSGSIFAGCNVEHRFRCHDVHAEVNALTSMVAAGGGHVLAILIVAEREFFMPCGGCLDWIMELGSGDVLVGFQGFEGGPLQTRYAKELMPYYPQ